MNKHITMIAILLGVAVTSAGSAGDDPFQGKARHACFAYTASVEETASLNTGIGSLELPIVRYVPRPVACDLADVSLKGAATAERPAQSDNTIALIVRDGPKAEPTGGDRIQRMILRLFTGGHILAGEWKYLPGIEPAPQADLAQPKFRIAADEGPTTVHGCMCWDEEVCEPTLSGLTLCRKVRKCGCWNTGE